MNNVKNANFYYIIEYDGLIHCKNSQVRNKNIGHK